MKKRILALVLSVTLLMSMVPGTLATSAASDTSTTQVVVDGQEPTGTAAPDAVACDNCGAEDHAADDCMACTECKQTEAHAEGCSLNLLTSGEEGSQPTTTPTVSGNDVETDPTTTPTTAPQLCETCGAEGCTSTHETWCAECKKDDCGVDHSSQPVPCETCGAEGCTSTHETWCAECKKDDCGVDHNTQPTTEPTTEPTVGNCEHCGVALTEDAVHEATCLTNCTCTPVEGVHQGECVFAPVVENAGPQVGDTIWINANSVVYKKIGDTEGHTLWGNYEVKIKSIVDNEWYEFEFINLGVGEFFLQIGGYKYVRIENTSVEEPAVDENACNCGENAAENLADHADSCPRKQYIKTLFEGKTAEEIYAQWETYDEATQNDILNMLQVYDNAKYEALKKLIDGTEKETTVGEISLKVQGVPANVQVSVSDVNENEYHEGISEYVNQNSELLYVYDITLTNPDGSVWQPNEGRTATVTLDFNGTGLADGNSIKVLHEHNNSLNYLGEYVIEDGKLTFTTDGFSKFYFYITYTFGGHGFTMSGGSTVYLSEILRELNISKGVSQVTRVTFSNPDVLKITRVGGDWELESLSPFGSEETLTIVFSDGETIEIAVKDPVIYNYGVANTVTKVPQLLLKDLTMGDIAYGDNYATGKEYETNKDVITNAELIAAAGSASSVDIIIYARPNTAIGFKAGTTWPDGSRPTHDESGIWFWCWDGQVNYAVVKEGTAGKQATFPIHAVSGNTNVTVNVTICSVAESSPTLLQDNLPEGYTIKNVPVTLYDYDGIAWNKYYNNARLGNYFAFAGTTDGVNVNDYAPYRGWTESGLQANGGGSVALMGIMQERLDDNRLPVTSQGQKVDLFSATNGNGRTAYPNVNFQFVYNEETGYYSYNSALNHAQYNKDTNTIELYKQSLAISDTPNGASHGNAGFYPFSNIYDAYTNTGYSAMTEEEWIAALERDPFKLIPAQYSADIVTSDATNPVSTENIMHFGIQVASDFYMPKGKQLNGHDLMYEFTGDDDLWVFVDGKLVLDIGGGHTHVSGSVNLTTGEVWVEKYTQLAAADGGSYAERKQGENLRYKDNFLTGLQDDQMHTIQIFYLERHSGVSNCLMRFNLPLVPSNAVNVSKNLVNQDGEDLSVTPDVDYIFSMYKGIEPGSGDDEINAVDFKPHANAEYTVTGPGAPSGTQRTNDEGEFTLKDGWIASFSGIQRYTEVYVVESEPNDGYNYVESTVSVNDGDAEVYAYGQKTEIKVMQLNSSINFHFVNKMQTQPLTIEKKVVNGTEGLLNENQEFEFTLDFTKKIVETGTGAITATKGSGPVALTDGTFKLKHGESITIPKVPVNMTYTVKETNPDTTNNSFDAPVFTVTTSTSTDETAPTAFAFDTAYEWKMADDDENKITVTNQQRFNLTITKSGIQDVDHHNATASENEEKQSTIYEVIGANGFEMQVAICGNESVTIMALPVGKYTVKELTDWSWRYEVKSGTEVSRNVDPHEYTETVDYENTREEIYWLSGDSYVENWFSNGIKKRNGKNDIISN